MPMTRQDRVNSQKKQDKILILDGVPLAADLKEGVPTLRKTKEGLVEYVKHANVLYKNVMKLAAKADVAPAVVSTTTITIDPSDGIISQSKADDGYAKFGAGLIIQWGQETADSSTKVVTFPLVFPNACLNITCTDYHSGDTGGAASVTALKTLPTTTTATFTCYTAADTFFWVAIGH